MILELGSQKVIDDIAFHGRNGPGLKIGDLKRAGPGRARIPTGRAGPSWAVNFGPVQGSTTYLAQHYTTKLTLLTECYVLRHLLNNLIDIGLRMYCQIF